MRKHSLPATPTLLFTALFFSVLFLGPRLFSLDGDLGRHLTIGSYILNSHKIPVHDIFSHTLNGQPLTPHEWLAQVIFAASYRWLGLGGTVLVTAIIIAAAWFIVLQDARRRTPSWPLLVWMLVLLAGMASSLHWLARPHIFTFLYLALWTQHLESLRRGASAPLWKTALLMLLWVNTHGAFIAGFVIWGAYQAAAWLEKESGPPARVWIKHGLLAAAVTLLNPVGWRIWETTFSFLGSHYLVSHTGEYQPPDFQNPSVWPFMLMVGLSIFLAMRNSRRLPLAHAFLLSGWTLMALYSARNIPLYALVAAPILATAFPKPPDWWQSREGNWRSLESRAKNQGVWLALFVLAGVFWLKSPLAQSYNRYSPQRFPVQASDWLTTHPQNGDMFNYFDWGGYLLYRFWPQEKVFIDGQTDFYGEALTRTYEEIITGAPGWEQKLADYHVSWAILPPDEPLARRLQAAANWQQVYQDETAVIFAQKTP